jgi:hypothetical protein
VESVEREVRWLSELINAERSGDRDQLEERPVPDQRLDTQNTN